MKKKLLENDIFYLSLFVCVCLVAVGGLWLTNNNVNKLASNNADENQEIHLIDSDRKEAIPTTTDSDQNLAKAKEEKDDSVDKLGFLGNKVIREFSEKEPSYSETLNVWEIHKGIDVSTKEGQEVKSLLSGKVIDVYKDDENGMSVKIQSDNDIIVVYSNLSEDIKVEKNQEIKEEQCIGLAGNTTSVESKGEQHIHVEAFKGKEPIDPMSLID